MFVKKATIVFFSSSNVFCVPPSITSSCSPGTRSRNSPPTGHKRPQSRCFATVHDEEPLHKHGHPPKDHSLRWPASNNPTPYDIFHVERGAPYSKARFVELVKLYHPDRRHHTAHYGISHATRLERYRLIVAANDILRDPTKRRAYDLYGAGWADKSDMENLYRQADRAWRQRPGNPANNATWEDWEKWYEQRDGKKQQPLYMSNAGFMSLILLLAVIGGWGQATRVDTNGSYYVDMQNERHEYIGMGMQQRANQAWNYDRERRIQHFLRRRDT
jgi:hypothetical protein